MQNAIVLRKLSICGADNSDPRKERLLLLEMVRVVVITIEMHSEVSARELRISNDLFTSQLC